MINAPQFAGIQASILNQAKRRRVQAGKAVDDADEAPHSRTTRDHMQRFFNAFEDDDEHEQRHAFGKVVEAWRADNAAGGLAVYAHMPLPGIFAKAVADAVGRAPPAAGATIAKGITANLEPGTRAAVLQQLRDAAGKSLSAGTLPSREPALASTHAGVGLAGEEGHDNNLSSALKSLLKHEQANAPGAAIPTNRVSASASLFAQAQKGLRVGPDAEAAFDVLRPSSAEYRPERDGDPVLQNLPWDRRPIERTLAQGMTGGQPTIPEPAGDQYDSESDWSPTAADGYMTGPSITRRGSQSSPPAIPIPHVPNEFQPNAWYNDRGAKTERGKVLLAINDLGQPEQTTLSRRRWMHPTGVTGGNAKLSQGYGYFGARRGTSGSHGGLDCPANNDNTVQMPTDARLVEIQRTPDYQCKDANGNPIIDRRTGRPKMSNHGDTLIFDLGNGIRLSLQHVRRNRALRVGQDVRMGEQIGAVDHDAYCGKNDHTHMQLTMRPGRYNGDYAPGFAIDPTDLVLRNGEPIGQLDPRNPDGSWRWEDLFDVFGGW